MKLKLLTTAILLTQLAIATPLRAENPEHVKQLLQTKSCEGCDLRGANLSGANLSFAVLVGADLRGANLKNANLSQADLTRANLSQANFQGAILDRAYLTNANLEQTNLVGASLDGTRGLPIMNLPLAQIPPLPPLRSQISLPPLRPLPPLNIPPLSSVPRLAPRPPLAKPLPSLGISKPPDLTAPTLPESTTIVPRISPRQETNNPPQPSQQPVNIYPEKLIQVFMDSCTKEGNVRGVNVEQLCTCSINKIQNEYTLEEFMNLSLEMTQNKKTPERIVQIAVECTIENFTSTEEVSLNLP